MPAGRWRATKYVLLVASFLGIGLSYFEVYSQEPQDPPANRVVPESAEAEPPGKLRFSFDGAPWRVVIKWLADRSDLALHLGDVPTGSFTYSDPKEYAPSEAIARVNLFLLPEGFTLVRSGKLLSVLNLGDPQSRQQLDVLAELVTVEKLDQLSRTSIAKCFFPLGDFPAEDAAKELSALSLMTAPVVLNRTNQLLVTDTVEKLRSVRTVLNSLKPSALDNGMVMKSFPLQHVDAEDVLAVARPHLGLATGEMIGIDVSLSADLKGKNIFVTGLADKVKVVEGLIKTIDIPQNRLSATDGKSVLRSHRVAGGNVDAVYNVLITLLAGKPVRLSIDQTTSSVVALAGPDVQAEIAKTVEELQAADAEFAVIQLKTLDPYFAISLLEEMLDLGDDVEDPFGFRSSNSRFNNRYDYRDRDDRRRDDRRRDDRRRDDRRDRRFDPPTTFAGPSVKPPKIDADPATKRLFVRGTKEQIAQIKKIVSELDQTSPASIGVSRGRIRVLPIRGKRAEHELATVARFWRQPNPILLFAATVDAEAARERTVNGEKTTSNLPPRAAGVRTARYLTDNIRSQAPPIRCQVTDRGLMLQSEDIKALDRLEEAMLSVAVTAPTAVSRPIVFYLKYAKAAEALRMLAELLDGGETAKEGEVGSLVKGTVGSTFSFGSIVTSRDGTMTMTADSITVIADPRLNRLIAQGTVDDIARIEEYLKIVDKDESIASIEVYGRSHVIELKHTKATVVAATIRDAYADRITGTTTSGRRNNNNGNNNNQNRQREQSDRRRDGERRDNDDRERGSPRRNDERSRSSGNRTVAGPRLTIAVHEPSNSLVVTAPDQLFKEVEQLARLIDKRSQQSVVIISPDHAHQIQSTLQQVFSASAGATQNRTNQNRRTPTNPPRPGRTTRSGR